MGGKKEDGKGPSAYHAGALLDPLLQQAVTRLLPALAKAPASDCQQEGGRGGIGSLNSCLP